MSWCASRGRIAAKVTAHSVGMMVNTLLDRSALNLADLAV